MNGKLRGLINRYVEVCQSEYVSVEHLNSCLKMKKAADNHDLKALDESVCDHAIDFIEDMESPPDLFGEIYDITSMFRK